MLIAIKVQDTFASKLQTGFGVLFGVEFHELYPVAGNISQKGNKMIFGHGVTNGDEMLIFHLFNGNRVVLVCFFGFQRGQRNTTTRNRGASHCSNNIATYRTNVKPRTGNVRRTVLVGNDISRKQFGNRNTQCLCQGFQQGNIRKPFPRFA